MTVSEWPKQHQNALVAFLLITFGAGALYFFVLRPHAIEVDRKAADLEDLKKKVADSGWPADVVYLENKLDTNQRKLNGTNSVPGVKAQAQDVLKLGTSLLDSRIHNMVSSTGEFMRNVTRIDYETEYDNLEQYLRGHRNPIIIAEKVFGLSRDSADLETYQLLLQVWTVREVVERLRDSSLRVQVGRTADKQIPTPGGPARGASLITVLPPKPYILSAEDSEPYIYEFRVKVSVYGSVQEVCAFLASLHGEKAFLPLSQFELKASPPQRGQSKDDANTLSSRYVAATMVCSAFFRPGENAPKVNLEKAKVLPPGA